MQDIFSKVDEIVEKIKRVENSEIEISEILTLIDLI